METRVKNPEVTREGLDRALANAALEGLRPDAETKGRS